MAKRTFTLSLDATSSEGGLLTRLTSPGRGQEQALCIRLPSKTAFTDRQWQCA